MKDQIKKFVNGWPLSSLACIMAATFLVLFLVFSSKATAHEGNEQREFPGYRDVAYGSGEYWSDFEKLPYHIELSVNFWRPQLGNTAYAFSNSSNVSEPIYGETTTAAPQWAFGASIGVGYELYQWDWDLLAKYSFFLPSFKNSASKSSGGRLVGLKGFSSSGGVADTASSDISIHWHNLSGLVDKKFHFREDVVVFTSMGLQSTWLKYRDLSTYTFNGASEFVRTTSQIWAIGPKVGGRVNWLFAKDFYFLSSLSSSFQYAKSCAEFDQTNSPQQTWRGRLTDRNDFVTPSFDYAVGFGFANYYFKRDQFIRLEALYQGEYLFNFIQKIQAVRIPTTNAFQEYSFASEGIGFQGFTLKLDVRY